MTMRRGRGVRARARVHRARARASPAPCSPSSSRGSASSSASTSATSRSTVSPARCRAARRSASSSPTRSGANLADTLYVLDEPTIGLHPRDTRRLVAILERAGRARRTPLVVVEHEPLRDARGRPRHRPRSRGRASRAGDVLYAGPEATRSSAPTPRPRAISAARRRSRARRNRAPPERFSGHRGRHPSQPRRA